MAGRNPPQRIAMCHRLTALAFQKLLEFSNYCMTFCRFRFDAGLFINFTGGKRVNSGKRVNNGQPIFVAARVLSPALGNQ
jgi:hypothetical protein